MRFSVLPGAWAIARLDPAATVPEWAFSGAFASVTRTPHELPIVCAEAAIPASCRAERGWAAVKLIGPFSFSEVGVLDSVTRPLAQARVSFLAVSTFDPDDVLVRAENLARALAALEKAGRRLEE